ncbi:MAG: glycosyltransferase family protein, partial [Alphaproteobacteria bacterium]
FSDLIDASGQPIDDEFRQARRNELLSVFKQQQPAIVIIEAFPFGRRQMRFELIPLLEMARSASPKPLVVCSIRDILQSSNKPERITETLDLVNEYFDYILVHGDPNFATLDETFPGAAEIAGKIRYTGMVAEAGAPQRSHGLADGEILVSAGGGATHSERLLETAIAAKPLSCVKERHWRLLAGPNLPEEEYGKLVSKLPEGITLEPNRDDFTSLLAQCAVSVSQAGYNTVVDLIRSRCRTVLAPYSARGETEQVFRARRFKEKRLAQVVEAGELDPETLANAIDEALAGPPPEPASIDLDGAEKSASLISAWLKG